MLGFLAGLVPGGGAAGLLLKGWKWIVLALFIVAIYFYHQSLINKIDSQEDEINSLNREKATLTANVEKLKENIEIVNNTVHLLESQRAYDQKKIIELSLQENEARKEIKALKEKFSKHDLDHLSLKKPGLIQNIINKGTKQVHKDLEDLTDPSKIETIK